MARNPAAAVLRIDMHLEPVLGLELRGALVTVVSLALVGHRNVVPQDGGAMPDELALSAPVDNPLTAVPAVQDTLV